MVSWKQFLEADFQKVTTQVMASPKMPGPRICVEINVDSVLRRLDDDFRNLCLLDRRSELL